MKPEDVDQLTLSTVFLPARPSSSDPLSQRAFLAIKLTGALHIIVGTDDEETGVKLLCDTIRERVEETLRDALKRPDETVVSVTGSC